jgi:hypothetical protein
MMAAGRANVREITCNDTTKVNEGHTIHGIRGRMTRKGMRRYEMGEKGRNMRNEVSVPSFA